MWASPTFLSKNYFLINVGGAPPKMTLNFNLMENQLPNRERTFMSGSSFISTLALLISIVIIVFYYCSATILVVINCILLFQFWSGFKNPLIYWTFYLLFVIISDIALKYINNNDVKKLTAISCLEVFVSIIMISYGIWDNPSNVETLIYLMIAFCFLRIFGKILFTSLVCCMLIFPTMDNVDRLPRSVRTTFDNIRRTFKTEKYLDCKNNWQHGNDLPTTCSICIEDFEDDETIICTPCNHIYHKPCIDQWFGSNLWCPICRTNLLAT